MIEADRLIEPTAQPEEETIDRANGNFYRGSKEAR